MEQKYGRAKAWETVLGNRNQVIAFSKKNRVPIVDTSVENYMEILNANTYQKGGWVLHMLRKEVGDEMFWEAIRKYYNKYKLSNALSDDLKEVFESVSGKDLDVFFKQWVYQAGQPEIEATWSYSKGQLNLELNQTQKEVFTFDLEIELVYADGKTERKTVLINQKNQKWTPKLDSKPVKVILDPDAWLLFEATLIEK